MLNLWIGKDKIPSNTQFVYDPDAMSSFLSLDSSDEFVVRVLKEIELAEIQTDEVFTDRFGRGIYKQFLSTTTKILLGVRQNKKFCINISEIGSNGFNLLFKLNDGNIWLPNNNRDLGYIEHSIMLNGSECCPHDFDERYMEVFYESR